MSSKSAPIDDTLNIMNHNLQEAYTPKAPITVDEELFPYRGHTKFRKYFRSNPLKGPRGKSGIEFSLSN